MEIASKGHASTQILHGIFSGHSAMATGPFLSLSIGGRSPISLRVLGDIIPVFLYSATSLLFKYDHRYEGVLG